MRSGTEAGWCGDRRIATRSVTLLRTRSSRFCLPCLPRVRECDFAGPLGAVSQRIRRLSKHQLGGGSAGDAGAP